MSRANMDYELGEAKKVAKETLSTLYKMDKSITRVREMGIQGKLMKHLKLLNIVKKTDEDNAVQCLEAAKRDMLSLKKCLDQLNKYKELDLDFGEFYSFEYNFSANYIPEVLLETDPQEAQSRLWKAVAQVQKVLAQLLRNSPER